MTTGVSEIKFNTQVGFTGRNGYFTCTGLSIVERDEHITIRPITSKNQIGNCSIDIPKENITALIAQLKELIE